MAPMVSIGLFWVCDETSGVKGSRGGKSELLKSSFLDCHQTI